MKKMKKDNRALDNKCPACRAPIFYNPKLGKWKCEYCDSEFNLEELKKYNNASNDIVNTKDETDAIVYETYRCKNCGAEIVADKNTAATFCVYCGNTAILKSKLSGKFAPTKIIPFKKVKEDAVEAFKGLKKGRPLIPKNFICKQNIDKITGVYIPFWLYNLSINGNLTANGRKITTWVAGDYHFTKTDTYRIVRGGDMKFLFIPVDGSSRFADDIMNTIEPFDYKEMVDYNHAFLSGFLAEKYDVESKKAIVDAIKRAISSAESEMRVTMAGYNTINIIENGLLSKEDKHEYALLPVWMVNVKYKNKFYTFAMNGQTGEFVGNIPISVSKSILLFVKVFMIAFLLLTFISYVIFKIGV